MNLAEVMSSIAPENSRELVAILQDFIFAEKNLADATITHDKEVFLRMARRISTVLKAPPFNLSVELLSDICDDLNGWQAQITKWAKAHQ